jgi:hypothetical protein
MFHPLIRLIATRPHLLAHHLVGYADLASAQAADAADALAERALTAAVAAAAGLGGLLLAGMALLLLAVLPLQHMPAPWLLALVPALPLLLALAAWQRLRRRPWVWTAAPLRAQLAADMALLKDAAAQP